jgi:hypothetical protein
MGSVQGYGQERVVAFFSKTLSRDENCCLTQQELQADVKTPEHFHKHLHGQDFHLRTEHSALTWLLSFKNLEGHISRWVQCLQEYNFISEHRQGWMHINAKRTLQKTMSRRMRPMPERKLQAGSLRVQIITAAAADGWEVVPAVLHLRSESRSRTRSRSLMHQYDVEAPFERIAIDIAGHFRDSESGNRRLTAMDCFTNWPEVYAIPNQEV